MLSSTVCNSATELVAARSIGMRGQCVARMPVAFVTTSAGVRLRVRWTSTSVKSRPPPTTSSCGAAGHVATPIAAAADQTPRAPRSPAASDAAQFSPKAVSVARPRM